jgi:phage shock protein E
MNIELIEAKTLESLLQQKELLLIDVRQIEEWNQGHIKGATLVPLDTLPHKIKDVCVDTKHPIYLYCQRGRRSHQAALILLSLGYQNIHELEGGIETWIGAGCPCQNA